MDLARCAAHTVQFLRDECATFILARTEVQKVWFRVCRAPEPEGSGAASASHNADHRVLPSERGKDFGRRESFLTLRDHCSMMLPWLQLVPLFPGKTSLLQVSDAPLPQSLHRSFLDQLELLDSTARSSISSHVETGDATLENVRPRPSSYMVRPTI
jgi:hypothetical protein